MANAHGKVARALLAAGGGEVGGAAGCRTNAAAAELLECLVTAELYGPLLAPAAAELRDEVAAEAGRGGGWCVAAAGGEDVEAMMAALRGTRAVGHLVAAERAGLEARRGGLVLSVTAALGSALDPEVSRRRPCQAAVGSASGHLDADCAGGAVSVSQVRDIAVVDHALGKYSKYAADCGRQLGALRAKRRGLAEAAERYCPS